MKLKKKAATANALGSKTERAGVVAKNANNQGAAGRAVEKGAQAAMQHAGSVAKANGGKRNKSAADILYGRPGC